MGAGDAGLRQAVFPASGVRRACPSSLYVNACARATRSQATRLGEDARLGPAGDPCRDWLTGAHPLPALRQVYSACMMATYNPAHALGGGIPRQPSTECPCPAASDVRRSAQ